MSLIIITRIFVEYMEEQLLYYFKIAEYSAPANTVILVEYTESFCPNAIKSVYT